MKIVITGGAGFLGSRLARSLLNRGTLSGPGGEAQPIREIILFDHEAAADIEEPRVKSAAGDIGDLSLLRQVIGPDTDVVFHLAAVVSGEAEADFDLGMRVNVDGTRGVLDVCRGLPRAPRMVFASSAAVFGVPLPKVVTDATTPTPRSSYGTQKLMGELMVADYTRKGFVDGRSVRLPTIVVRPGRPNKAASSFASSIVREPLNRQPVVCPVAVPTAVFVLSPQGAIAALIHACELSAERWGADRSLNLPGITVSVAEMLAVLGRVAGKAAVERVNFVPDPVVERIVSTWPVRFDTARANGLGFKADAGFETILLSHIDDQGVRID